MAETVGGAKRGGAAGGRGAEKRSVSDERTGVAGGRTGDAGRRSEPPRSEPARGADAAAVADAASFTVHLLDVGEYKYGDCALCRFGDVRILIDGGHPGDEVQHGARPSIPQQLRTLLGAPPHDISLLVVTHAHEDHIGCLPAMVQQGLLNVEWALVADHAFGWGRLPTDAVPDSASRVNRLAAALREESRADVSDAALRVFLDNAASLEPDYLAMIEALKNAGTKVVRYGNDDQSALVQAFAGIGLKILGPSDAQLVKCAQVINDVGKRRPDAVADAFAADASQDELSVYRQLARRLAGQDFQSDGAAINNQSITLIVEPQAGRRALFTGDMQLASYGVSGLTTEMTKLKQAIVDHAPYSFVKLSHHGAANGLNATILNNLTEGSDFFGISTGIEGLDHPNPNVLNLLEDEFQTRWLRMARTDRNGRINVTLGPGTVKITKSYGKVNDFTPKGADEVARARHGEFGEGGEAGAVEIVRSGGGDQVEVTARVPHTDTRVTITIDVKPGGNQGSSGGEARSEGTAAEGETSEFEEPAEERESGESGDRPRSSVNPLGPLKIGGGRRLPKLLFVTSKRGLIENIGRAEAQHLLKSLRDQGYAVFDAIPADLAGSEESSRLVQRELARRPGIAGVVILGGYDVVPAQRLDTIPRSLRQRIQAEGGYADLDDFIVWSDAIYGDRDGDRLPELAVSRIPDGQSSKLMAIAIQAPGRKLAQQRTGIRNVARPFAEDVFAALPSPGTLLRSEPTIYRQTPRIDLSAARVYLMLHGHHADATRFWGEGTTEDLEAMSIQNVPSECGSVVFTGCCWGAMPVNVRARHATSVQSAGARSAKSSLALKFLEAGATAYIGCTGAHYSPVDPPYRSAGQPMHEAFWRHYNGGAAPAEALFRAKQDYLADLPHGQTDPAGRAIEFKTLRQFTCLGLGW